MNFCNKKNEANSCLPHSDAKTLKHFSVNEYKWHSLPFHAICLRRRFVTNNKEIFSEEEDEM
jgi:hypothetical protein